MNPGAARHAAKEQLRREIRARLAGMTPNVRAEASLVICEQAARWPTLARSHCVALFAPLPSEPDIHPLIEEAWAQGKRVVMPLMLKAGGKPGLDWHEIGSWEDVVVPGPFGLREPDPLRCPRLSTKDVNCAFVPGVAFDKTGLRLGRGGGYYDTFLGQMSAGIPTMGLMFACQRVDELPREAHDQSLSGVITEDGEQTFEAPLRQTSTASARRAS